MRSIPRRMYFARHLTSGYRRRSKLLKMPARTATRPARFEKQGDRYLLIDGAGKILGSIQSPGSAPRLGRNEGTVFLWRDN